MGITNTGKEPTILDTINELVLSLSIIAEDNDSWKVYQMGEEDKQVIIDRCENQIASYLRSLDEEMQRLRVRALNAETEWATFHKLTEMAVIIVEADYSIDTLTGLAPESTPMSILHFRERARSALKKPAPK